MSNTIHSGNETAQKKDQSVLESLYELWLIQDPAYDEQVQQLQDRMAECMGGMCLAEADRLSDVVTDLCIAYSRKGFLDGVKLGGLLIREILLGKWGFCFGTGQ